MGNKRSDDGRDVFDTALDDESNSAGTYIRNGILGAVAGAALLRGTHRLDKFLKRKGVLKDITTAPGGDDVVKRFLTKQGAVLGGTAGLTGTVLDDQIRRLRKKNRK